MLQGYCLCRPMRIDSVVRHWRSVVLYRVRSGHIPLGNLLTKGKVYALLPSPHARRRAAYTSHYPYTKVPCTIRSCIHKSLLFAKGLESAIYCYLLLLTATYSVSHTGKALMLFEI